MTINTILSELRNTSSRLGKESILKKNFKNDLLKKVIFLALNPYTQFYQRKIPEYAAKSKATMDLDSALVALSDLSERKVTGHAAIEYLGKLLSSTSKDDAEVLKCVVLKDLTCGVQAATANAVWENLIPEHPCMLASQYDSKLITKMEFPAIVQLKMDGMRFNALVDAFKKTVEYRSRNGKLIDVNTKEFDAVFLNMAKNIGMGTVVFDGELIVVDDNGQMLERKTGNGILNSLNRFSEAIMPLESEICELKKKLIKLREQLADFPGT